MVLSLIAALFLPSLLSLGMFFDGVTYASIARNLAEGKGSFWQLYYTDSIYPEFHEHPPLAIGIQSLFFTFLGDVFYIEKLYSFVCLCLTMLASWKLSRLYFESSSSWIPLLLILTVPIFSWSFQNNLLENTLTVFTTFSVFFLVNGIKKNRYLPILLGSLFCVLAFLSKGPVGLFPLATIFIYNILFRDKSAIWTKISLQFASLGIIFLAIFMLSNGAYDSIIEYLNHQVFAALQNKREITAGYRLKIIVELVTILAIPILLLLLTKYRKLKVSKEKLHTSYFFILTGMSASFPLLLSLKQSKFYLVPSIPFYCLGIAILIQPLLTPLFLKFEKLRAIKIGLLASILISFSLMIYNSGKITRDHVIITCAKQYEMSDATYTSIEAPEADCYNWTLVAYMMRLNRVSIMCKEDSPKLCQ